MIEATWFLPTLTDCLQCGKRLSGTEPVRLHFDERTWCNSAGLTAFQGMDGQVLWSYADDEGHQLGIAGAKGRNHPPGSNIAGLLNFLAGRQLGERNSALNWTAYWVGVCVNQGKLAEDDAVAQLVAVAMTLDFGEPGWEQEVRTTISSGMRAGMDSGIE